jgi:formate dehydrogenase major subunit
VVTTEFSDWATSCPEYKVAAVQVGITDSMSEWQKQYLAYNEDRRKLAESEDSDEKVAH